MEHLNALLAAADDNRKSLSLSGMSRSRHHSRAVGLHSKPSPELAWDLATLLLVTHTGNLLCAQAQRRPATEVAWSIPCEACQARGTRAPRTCLVRQMCLAVLK